MQSEFDEKDTSSKIAQTGSDAARLGKAIKNSASKKAASETAKQAANSSVFKDIASKLFGGFSTAELAPILAVVIGIFVVLAIVLCVLPGNTMFSSAEETNGKEVGYAMIDGFESVKEGTKKDIVAKMNSLYNCGASVSNVISNGRDGYKLSTKTCDIDISFTPDILTYEEDITAYIDSINGAITLYTKENEIDENELNNIEKPTQDLISIDDDGNVEFTDYGEEFKNTFSSEYTNSEGKEMLESAAQYSYKIFKADGPDEWDYDNFHAETITVVEDVCYAYTVDPQTYYKKLREFTPNITYEEAKRKTPTAKVSCSGGYDIKSKEKRTYKAEYGDITIHMSYDMSQYKPEKVEETIQGMIGTTTYERSASENVELYQTTTISDYETAKELFDNTVQEYYFNYISFYSPYEFGEGYTGLLTHTGSWNYEMKVTTSQTSVANAFWAYSNAKKSEITNLEYKSDNYGGYPSFTRQCTQYAGTWFVDTYGFAAIRGNGINCADNLVKDCGKEGVCPTQFIYGTGVAPGAVVSLYPNHVVVIEGVKDDGTILVNQGNLSYKGVHGQIAQMGEYSSITSFANSLGMTVKAIAIPKQ